MMSLRAGWVWEKWWPITFVVATVVMVAVEIVMVFETISGIETASSDEISGRILMCVLGAIGVYFSVFLLSCGLLQLCSCTRTTREDQEDLLASIVA